MREYVYSDAIHQRLYDVRKALKKTQVEMAREMGFSGAVYSKLETLLTTPIKEYVILSVCNTFGVNFDYLVFGDGPMFDDDTSRKKELQKMFSRLPEACQSHILDYISFLISKYDSNQ